MQWGALYKGLFLALLLFPAVSFAQNAGSAQPGSGTSTATSTNVGEAPASALATTTRATSTPAVATTTKPKPATTTPTVPPTTAATIATTTPFAPVDDEGNLLIHTVFALLIIVPFGFLLVQWLKTRRTKENTKEDTQHDPNCFNLKALLYKKLEEITDLRGRVEGKVQDSARDTVGGVLKGTRGGDALALLIQAEKQYGKLKKMYEECTVEFEKNAYKAIIVSQSLSDVTVLEKLQVKKTYKVGDWVLNNVLVSESQIPEISKYISNGPWYIHFWRSGSDDIKVLFKNKMFTIAHSDKSTWDPAIAYGKSIGIPKEQLDFPI
jgi:hypothetical protein